MAGQQCKQPHTKSRQELREKATDIRYCFDLWQVRHQFWEQSFLQCVRSTTGAGIPVLAWLARRATEAGFVVCVMRAAKDRDESAFEAVILTAHRRRER